MSHQTVILLRAHRFDAATRRLFAALQASCGSKADVVLLYNGSFDDPGVAELNPDEVFAHTKDDCRKLGLLFQSLWHDGHYPLLGFARARPSYDFYWMVEFDVRFTGSWSDLLLDSFSGDNADLLTTCVRRYPTDPEWSWWHTTSSDLELDELWSCFFPVQRFSSNALATLERGHQSGSYGFCEVVVPTILAKEGLVVRDLNENREPLYDRKSLRWRPYRWRAGSRPATLYHPVHEELTFSQYLAHRVRHERIRVKKAFRRMVGS